MKAEFPRLVWLRSDGSWVWIYFSQGRLPQETHILRYKKHALFLVILTIPRWVTEGYVHLRLNRRASGNCGKSRPDEDCPQLSRLHLLSLTVPGQDASNLTGLFGLFLSIRKSQRSYFLCVAHDFAPTSCSPCHLQRLSSEAHREACAAFETWGCVSLGKSLPVLRGSHWPLGVCCTKRSTLESPSWSQAIRVHKNPLSDTLAFLAVEF